MTFDKAKWSQDAEGLWLSLRVDDHQAARAICNEETVRDLIVKPHRPLRSNDANAYLWVLCDKIAKKVGLSKEQIYINAVRDVGVFDVSIVADKAVDKFIAGWQSRGLGWRAEIEGDFYLMGYKRVITYYGSSSYNTSEFHRLIDRITDEAKQLDISTQTPEEVERMISLYAQADKGT